MKTTYDFSKELLLRVKPSMAFKGVDFENWQKNARKKLSALLGMENFEKCPDSIEIEYTKEIEHGTETRFTFESEAGALAYLDGKLVTAPQSPTFVEKYFGVSK